MKNILDEKPDAKIEGRLRESLLFVNDADVKNKTVLDIGCGYGWCELNFLRKGVKKIVGIEITEADLATVKKSIHDKRAAFKVSGAIDLPFADNSFDTVVCWEVIEHIPKNTEQVMFQEIRRVLKKNGVLYLSTPYNNFFCKVLDPAWWLIGHRHYSKGSLESYGRENGFQVNKTVVKGGWWAILGLLYFYFAKWLFRQSTESGLIARKSDEEYKKNDGIFDIFVKYTKL